MDFFKNPKYKVIRIVLLLVIIVGAGWFAMSNMNQSKSNQGSVINQTPTVAPKVTTTTHYDAALDKNIKESTLIIPGGDSSGAGTLTLSCSGACSGNGCTIMGCNPDAAGGPRCSSCTCSGSSCSGCTCTRSISGGIPDPRAN